MNEHRPAMAPFIPAWLDDAGLSAAEFRVFCRISRRGDCHESVANIAKGCRLHPDTISESVIPALIDRGLITKENRPGFTSVLRVVSEPPTRNEYPPETEGQVSKPGAPSPKRRGSHPPETEGDKGNPFKGIPKGTNRASARGGCDLSKLVVPKKLNTLAFLNKWADWVKFRRGQKSVSDWHALFQEQLNWLDGFDEATAIEILSTSIRNGWQGLFPLKNTATKGNSDARQQPNSRNALTY